MTLTPEKVAELRRLLGHATANDWIGRLRGTGLVAPMRNVFSALPDLLEAVQELDALRAKVERLERIEEAARSAAPHITGVAHDPFVNLNNTSRQRLQALAALSNEVTDAR